MMTRRSAPTILPNGTPSRREVPEEVAVALTCNGSTQAVMMATPADLEDFARGFLLTEGIADPAEVESVEAVGTPRGIDVQIWLTEGAQARLEARRRSRMGPVGCGLCGIESLEEATRDLPLVASDLRMTAADVTAAMAALAPLQPLHMATRAAHAAGFWVPGQGMVAVREDVGRHNALDKLAGAMLRASTHPTDEAAGCLLARTGAVVLTSRVSLDMVQKCARMGAPVLIAAAAPTAAALDAADKAGITVVACARGDRFELFTHPDRIGPGEIAHVA
jgi:FdhD protein